MDSEPTYAELGSDDFSIELQTTSRQCCGSAGCLLTVEPELTLVGDSADIDPDVVYEITYEIEGDESGPVVATAELTNQNDLTFASSRISTDSSSTDVTVEIRWRGPPVKPLDGTLFEVGALQRNGEAAPAEAAGGSLSC